MLARDAIKFFGRNALTADIQCEAIKKLLIRLKAARNRLLDHGRIANDFRFFDLLLVLRHEVDQ